MSSKRFICPTEHYAISNSELNASTAHSIENFKATLGKRNENYGENDKENIMAMLKSKTIERLRKNDQTLRFDDLINITNVKTIDEKISFKKLKDEKTKERMRDVMYLADSKYIDQNVYFKQLFDHDMSDVYFLQLVTISIDLEKSSIKDSIKRNKKIYHNSLLRKFRLTKNSFSTFVSHMDDRYKIITNEMNIEVSNAKAIRTELEECEHIYEGAKNEVLRLLKVIMIPEASYMILTWLSPPEWKKEHNVQELKYDFTMSDVNVVQDDNENYMNYAYQRPLEEFGKDLQQDPVFDLYWESVEQVEEKLARLCKRTRDKENLMEVIRKPLDILNHRQQYTNTNVQLDNKHTLKENILLNKDNIGQIMSAYEPLLETAVENHSIHRIKSMAIEMYTELNNVSYGDHISVNKALEFLFTRLYELRLESKKIPANIWKLTKQILNKINDDERERQLILNPKISIHTMKCKKPSTDIMLIKPLLRYKNVIQK